MQRKEGPAAHAPRPPWAHRPPWAAPAALLAASWACARAPERDRERDNASAGSGTTAAAVAAPPSPSALLPHSLPAGVDADTLLRQYVQEALSAKANGGSTKLYDQ